MGVRESLGRGVGGLLAPLAAEGSLLRGARVVHADGVVARAEVLSLAGAGVLGRALAHALEGPALVRFSGAVFGTRPGHAPPDVLGAAVRFHAGPGGAPDASSQDLLFLSFQHLWQLPIAPLLTDPRDYLANAYATLLPFRVPGEAGTFGFRLVPERSMPEGADRRERLERAMARGRASIRLDMRARTWGAPHVPIASIRLIEPAGVDQEALRFDPFRAGAGIVPAGFLQAMRAAAYPASQLGRAVARGPRG